MKNFDRVLAVMQEEGISFDELKSYALAIATIRSLPIDMFTARQEPVQVDECPHKILIVGVGHRATLADFAQHLMDMTVRKVQDLAETLRDEYPKLPIVVPIMNKEDFLLPAPSFKKKFPEYPPRSHPKIKGNFKGRK